MKTWVKNVLLILVIIVCIFASFFIDKIANDNIEYVENDLGIPTNLESSTTESSNYEYDSTFVTSDTSDSELNEETTISSSETNSNEETTTSALPNKPDDLPVGEGTYSRTFTFGYYVAFFIVALIFAFFFVYRGFSSNNQKTLKESFAYKKKYYVFILSVITVTYIYFVLEIAFGYIYLDIAGSNEYKASPYILSIQNGLSVTNGAYSSDSPDENAAIITGSTQSVLTNLIINKTGNGSSLDNGVNASINIYGSETNVIFKKLNLNSNGKYATGFYVDDIDNLVVSDSMVTTKFTDSPILVTNSNVTFLNSTLKSEMSTGFILKDNANVNISGGSIDIDNKASSNFILSSDKYLNNSIYLSITDTFIKTSSGNLFTVKNNDSVINLDSVTLSLTDSLDNLLKVSSSSVTMNLNNGVLKGNILLSDSNITLNLSSSTYQGLINSDDSSKSISLKLDSSSKLFLTGDTYLSSLDDEDLTLSNIETNNYNLYVNNVLIK